jgi:hypothetical protein
MPNNIAEFRAVVFDYGGLQGLDRFQLRFPLPPSLSQFEVADQSTTMNDAVRFMEFFCNTADLPGVGVATRNIVRYGYGASEKKPVFPVFNDVMLTFYNDNSDVNLQVFQQWMASIVNYKFNRSIIDSQSALGYDVYDLTYKAEYAVDAQLTLFDEHGTPQYTVAMRDFYPIMIPETKLAWESSNQFMQIVVMFTFTDMYLVRPDGFGTAPGQFGL